MILHNELKDAWHAEGPPGRRESHESTCVSSVSRKRLHDSITGDQEILAVEPVIWESLKPVAEHLLYRSATDDRADASTLDNTVLGVTVGEGGGVVKHKSLHPPCKERRDLFGRHKVRDRSARDHLSRRRTCCGLTSSLPNSIARHHLCGCSVTPQAGLFNTGGTALRTITSRRMRARASRRYPELDSTIFARGNVVCRPHLRAGPGAS
jgi:hypothetical protein